MKLLKIFVIKIIKTKTSFYTVFELKSFKLGFGRSGGTLIRSNLLRSFYKFKITKVLFYVRNLSNNSSTFYNVNQYLLLEEVKEPIEKLVSNLRKIVFYNSGFSLRKKNIIGEIDVNGNNYVIKGKDIKINESSFKYNMNHYIGKIVSPNIGIKSIFKIEKKKDILFSPIKKVNFLIKVDKTFSESLVLELLTDQSVYPFILFKKLLEELKELNNIIL